jgi:hypothetical protein
MVSEIMRVAVLVGAGRFAKRRFFLTQCDFFVAARHWGALKEPGK